MNTRIISLFKALEKMDIYVNDPLLLKIAASSISSIISLGYPPIMAKIMREMFGDNAFLVSKWLKEYRGNDSSFISNSIRDNINSE